MDLALGVYVRERDVKGNSDRHFKFIITVTGHHHQHHQHHHHHAVGRDATKTASIHFTVTGHCISIKMCYSFLKRVMKCDPKALTLVMLNILIPGVCTQHFASSSKHIALIF